MAFRNYKLDIDEDLFDRQRGTLEKTIQQVLRHFPKFGRNMLWHLRGIQELCDEIADQIADTTQQEGE